MPIYKMTASTNEKRGSKMITLNAIQLALFNTIMTCTRSIDQIETRIDNNMKDFNGEKSEFNKAMDRLIKNDLYTTIELNDLSDDHHDNIIAEITNTLDRETNKMFIDDYSNGGYDLTNLLACCEMEDVVGFMTEEFSNLKGYDIDKPLSGKAYNEMQLEVSNNGLDSMKEVAAFLGRHLRALDEGDLLSLRDQLSYHAGSDHCNIWIISDNLSWHISHLGFEVVSVGSLNLFVSADYQLKDDVILHRIAYEMAYSLASDRERASSWERTRTTAFGELVGSGLDSNTIYEWLNKLTDEKVTPKTFSDKTETVDYFKLLANQFNIKGIRANDSKLLGKSEAYELAASYIEENTKGW